MARPLRIEYVEAYYHVASRGNQRKAIFRDDLDRKKFVYLVVRWQAVLGPKGFMQGSNAIRWADQSRALE